MRLKSNFKDYYDGLLATDQEPEPLYLRDTRQVERPHDIAGVFRAGNENRVHQGYFDINSFTVVIGRDIHLGYRLQARDKNRDPVANQIVYDLAGVDKFVAAHFNELANDYYLGRRTDWRDARQLEWAMPPRRSLEMVRDNWAMATAPQLERVQLFMQQHRSPTLLAVYGSVLASDPLHPERGQYWPIPERPNDPAGRWAIPKRLADPVHLFLHPNLKRLEFYRVEPAAQAYQSIRQWLSNLTNPEKPVPALDDVTLAESKGFDKFSFRKEPKRKR